MKKIFFNTSLLALSLGLCSLNVSAEEIKCGEGTAFLEKATEDITENTATLKKALSQNGVRVEYLCPNSIYTINKPLLLGDGVTIEGGSAEIKAVEEIDFILATEKSVRDYGMEFGLSIDTNIHNLKLNGNDLAKYGLILSTTNGSFINITSKNNLKDGVVLTSKGLYSKNGLTNFNGININQRKANDNSFVNLFLENNKRNGFAIYDGLSFYLDTKLIGSVMIDNDRFGVWIENAIGLNMTGNHLSANGVLEGDVLDTNQRYVNYLGGDMFIKGYGVHTTVNNNIYESPLSVKVGGRQENSIFPFVISGSTFRGRLSFLGNPNKGQEILVSSGNRFDGDNAYIWSRHSSSNDKLISVGDVFQNNKINCPFKYFTQHSALPYEISSVINGEVIKEGRIGWLELQNLFPDCQERYGEYPHWY